MVVACDADAEDGDDDADELDGGLGVPCHGDCDCLLISWSKIVSLSICKVSVAAALHGCCCR